MAHETKPYPRDGLGTPIVAGDVVIDIHFAKRWVVVAVDDGLLSVRGRDYDRTWWGVDVRLADRNEALRRHDLLVTGDCNLVELAVPWGRAVLAVEDSRDRLEDEPEAPDIDHEDTTFPTCPRCGWECHELGEEGVSSEDDGQTEIECGRCDRPFRTTTSVAYTFTTEPIDREAERAEAERQRARFEDLLAKGRERASKMPPGTRVRVIATFYAPHIRDRVGTIANSEMTRGGFLTVDLEARERDGIIDRACRLCSTDPSDLEVVR
jgi:hypothetical protein